MRLFSCMALSIVLMGGCSSLGEHPDPSCEPSKFDGGLTLEALNTSVERAPYYCILTDEALRDGTLRELPDEHTRSMCVINPLGHSRDPGTGELTPLDIFQEVLWQEDSFYRSVGSVVVCPLEFKFEEYHCINDRVYILKAGWSYVYSDVDHKITQKCD